MKETTPVLRVQGLSAFIGTSRILTDVSLEAPQGKITMLIGRNGVGKTTTLRSIMGLNKPAGSITFGKEEIAGLKPHEIAQMGIGYVPEDRDVFHGLTVRENLQLAERRKTSPRYDFVYEVFPEMKKREKQLAGTLSGGQQQMLSVARVLLNDSPLLLIDEPTKGLAPRIVAELVVVLERAAEVSTIVMVEQNLAVVRRLAQHVLVMDRGRIVAEGSAEELLRDPEKVHGYLGVGRAGGSE